MSEDVIKQQQEEFEKQKATKDEIVIQAKAIEIDENGLINAKDNAELLRYCGALTLSGMVPDRFSDPKKLFGALMFVRDLGLSDTSIRQVANIKGSPSLFGDLPLALVQKSNQLAYFKEEWFDSDYKIINFENKNLGAAAWGAVCSIARGSIQAGSILQTSQQTFSFTLDDAKAAGLYPSKSSDMPWSKYTKLMLRYKARSIALKSVFADLISGVSIAEYDHDVLGTEDMQDVTPVKNKAQQLTEAYKKETTSTDS